MRLKVRNGEDFSYIECMSPLEYQRMVVKKTSFPEMECSGSIISKRIRDSSRMVTSISIMEEPTKVANALSRTLLDESQVLLRIPKQSNMYSFDLHNVVPSGDLTILFAKASIDESILWHRRLGHVNFKTMNKLVKGNLVRGLPLKIFENDHTCVACQKGKQHKATLTDDFSRFGWVFFLATKDETSKVLKLIITAIENQINKKVKVIRCDNGMEFKNMDLDEFCEMKGIKREYSNARTLQQNGVAERNNRTLIDANLLLPITFWAEVVNTACYVLNRALVTKPHNQTPYKLLNGRSPRLDFMRPFNCPVTILNTLDPLGKFKGKADEEFLVGYSVTSKAFRVFNTKTKKVKENMHVRFLENKQNVAVTGPNWLFDIDSLTNSMNYIPVYAGNQTDKNVGLQDTNGNVDDKVEDDTCSNTVVEPVDKEDQTYRDELDRLMSKEKEASDAADSFRTFSAGGPSSPHPDAFIPDDTLLHFDQDDSQIPDLEDTAELRSTCIFTSAYYDDLDTFTSLVQSVGTEADFNNMESSTIVSPILTHRVHMDHPKDQILRDLKSAVQTWGMAKKSSGAHAFVAQALDDESWVEAMQVELLQFSLQKVWRLVDLPYGKNAIGTKWVYQNKKDKRGIVVRNKVRLVAQGNRQEEGIDYDEAPHSPEYVPDPIEMEDHVPAHILEHPEDLVPAKDEAPIEASIHEMRVAVPSTYHSLLPSGIPPLLPIPLPVPSTSRRAEIPEADMSPQKRLLLTAPRPGCEVGESSAATRQPGPTMARSVDCSFVDTIETRFRDTERRMMTALEMVNMRISYQVDVRSRESLDFYSRHHDAQKDRAAVRAEIECQTADDLAVQHIMRTQALEAGARIDTLEDTTSNDPYVEVALQAPPSPDYMPGPEEPEQAPPSPGYVPGPEHADDKIVAEGQPYAEDASPIAQSPEYVPESDFEMHPEDDDDEDPEEDPVDYPADGGDDGDDEEESSKDDEDEEDDEMDVEADEEEEEEEEHPAPADSVVVAPTAADQAPSAEEMEPFETDESAATPPPHPAYRTTARISIPAPVPVPAWTDSEVV
nr:hypothetical protein [Tanacetum cinerariifolium]